MSKLVFVKDKLAYMRDLRDHGTRWGHVEPEDTLNFMRATIEALDMLVSHIEDKPDVKSYPIADTQTGRLSSKPKATP